MGPASKRPFAAIPTGWTSSCNRRRASPCASKGLAAFKQHIEPLPRSILVAAACQGGGVVIFHVRSTVRLDLLEHHEPLGDLAVFDQDPAVGVGNGRVLGHQLVGTGGGRLRTCVVGFVVEPRQVVQHHGIRGRVIGDEFVLFAALRRWPPWA